MTLNTPDYMITDWNSYDSNGAIWSKFEHLPMEDFETFSYYWQSSHFPLSENLEKKYRKAYSETAESSFKLSNFFVGFINSSFPWNEEDAKEMRSCMVNQAFDEIKEFKRSYCKLCWASDDIHSEINYHRYMKNHESDIQGELGEHESC